MNSKSLLDVDDLSNDQVQDLFKRAKQLATQGFPVPDFQKGKLCALLFFEDSTRTRFSFEIACRRLGMASVRLEEMGSSLSKGETLLDTFLNVQAMKPDFFVIRYREDNELYKALRESSIPVISGGEGKTSHPTQALLDAFTIQQERGQIRGEKVLIVGDVGHSRVAASNIKLLTRLGAEVAVTGPQILTELPAELESRVKRFASLQEGLAWGTVVMALRVQLERLHQGVKTQFSTEQYVKEFGIHREQLKHLRKDAILMHPGPVNQGVELDSYAMADSKSRILQQTENGVYIRSAILEGFLS